MGKKIYDEDLRLNLILNGEALNNGSKLMVAALGKLEQEMVRSEQDAKKLSAEIKTLEATVNGKFGEIGGNRQRKPFVPTIGPTRAGRTII